MKPSSLMTLIIFFSSFYCIEAMQQIEYNRTKEKKGKHQKQPTYYFSEDDESHYSIELQKIHDELANQKLTNDEKKLLALTGLHYIVTSNKPSVKSDLELAKASRIAFKKILEEQKESDFGLGYESDEEKSKHERVRKKYAITESNTSTKAQVENEKTQLNTALKYQDEQIAALNRQLLELTTKRASTQKQISQKEALVNLIDQANAELKNSMEKNKDEANRVVQTISKEIDVAKANLQALRTTKTSDATEFARASNSLEEQIAQLDKKYTEAQKEYSAIKNKIETGRSDPNTIGARTLRLSAYILPWGKNTENTKSLTDSSIQ